ncbi:MAG: DNA polymerase III subunit alpha [Microgenomates group bacterium Gr01-1014_7]|nr:MAG: DNA polymerase III subunit alpha [Microgenomates group bacterium Gr01-1014_7]
MSRFVHLHGHSEYSLLDGLSKIQKLVKATKDLGMDSVAITDHGVMYGVIEFYKECISQGIKPIIGVEMYVARRSHSEKQGKADSEPYHLTVLAKNYQGYLNLMKLTSIAHLQGFYYRPRVDKALLREYREGLIVLSGCPAGEFIRSIDQDLKKATEVAKEYLEIFGEGNYYFELQNHEYTKLLENTQMDQAVRRDLENMEKLQDQTWKAVKVLSPKLKVPMVATNDYHYIKEEEADAQDALVCVQTGKLISDIDRLRLIDTPNLYLRSPLEMKALFHEIPESLENTVKLAKECNVEIPLGKASFPIFSTPEGLTSMEYLRQITFEKAQTVLKMTDEEKERLEYELSVIEKKKYADYFLVVYDFVSFAHEHGIITNTRGSAAGSLILFCLGVTNSNPLDYKLPFERFLTVHRPTLPDIDVDLADDRRDEVIKYVMEKYGEDKVAHIVTFGTMMGRAAIRDTGRVLGMPYGEVDRIAKLIPPPHQGFHKPLKDAIKEVPELSELYRNNEQIKTLLDLAQKVEGSVRHASVHAAGVVIAPEPLTRFTPLQKEADGDKVVSQYDMFSISEEYGGVGLSKIDFLGIRNLSILGHAVSIVKETKGVDIDLNHLPLDDKAAFEILSQGETMGIFQMEGSGMTRYMKELKPTSIFDIMAMVALFRPGPMGSIPDYIARKNDPSKIKYFDPRMKEYMEQSLGLLVYQEDVLLTAINLAGYSWEEADKFRKAMGKKSPSEMAKQQDKFVEGCVTNGMKQEKAEELFALIAPFAAYGFNKAHAASYAMIAYQTAYMKANFPVEFMAAVMTAESEDADKIAAAIEECKRLGIVVLPPDINKSFIGFTMERLKELSAQDLERSLSGEVETKVKQGIRFGLSAVKNVGVLAIESILKAREESAPFVSLMDICERVDTRLVNRKTLESLIKAGALDSFGQRSSQLLILDQALEESHKRVRSQASGQGMLFEEDSTFEITLPQVEELPLEQLLVFEKDLLGFYLHEPPFLAKLQRLGDYVSCKISDLSDDHIGQKLTLGGVISEVKKVLTKKTRVEMAFVKLSDGVTEIECVVFPQTYSLSRDFLLKDEVVLMWGRIDKREENLSLVVDNTSPFEEDSANKVVTNKVVTNKVERNETDLEGVEITVPKGVGVDILQRVNRTLRQFPGDEKVTLLLPNGSNELRRMILPFSINPDSTLEGEIKNILGDGAFRRG